MDKVASILMWGAYFISIAFFVLDKPAQAAYLMGLTIFIRLNQIQDQINDKRD